jgi:hypothetical protein
MSFGGGGHGNLPDQPGWAFPSDPEDQAEQTFEFRRVPQDDGFGRVPQDDGFGRVPPHDGFGRVPPHDGFGRVPPHDGFGRVPPHDGFGRMAPDDYRALVGRTVPPRAQARVTRDMRPPGRRWGRIWLLAVAIAVPVAAGIVIGLLVAPGSTPAAHTGALEEHAPPAGRPTTGTIPTTHTSPTTNANPGPAVSADCPVGTSPTARAIANALARDPSRSRGRRC